MEEYIQNGGYELYSEIKEGKIKKESVVEELKTPILGDWEAQVSQLDKNGKF